MGRKMSRGKQQVLFNYLPERTFDFELATIARVRSIRGTPRSDLNTAALLRKIAEVARIWDPANRPALRDDVLRDPERFVLLDPREVQAEMFPKVFWCDNPRCGRVYDYSQRDDLPRQKCIACNTGQLKQLRFVKIHRCGSLESITPPRCQQCKTTSNMALDKRRSERFFNFRWICRRCGSAIPASAVIGNCRACVWPGNQNMDMEVHRAGRTFYAHNTVLLNIPKRQFDSFFNLQEWPAIVAAKFFNLPEVGNRALADFNILGARQETTQDTSLTGSELEDLFNRQAKGELTPEQVIAEMQSRIQQRRQEQQAASPTAIVQSLTQQTGVPWPTWEQSGQEIMEAVMPIENGNSQQLLSTASSIASRLGLSLTLVSDFPILTATYGYSRAEYEPNQCWLRPFPPEREYDSKFPIFVDEVQADAILLTLDPERVCFWLERNGFPPILPNGSDPYLARRGYFVQLFDNILLRETLLSDQPQERLVFGLLHTLSHLCVRQAALFCGQDRTSLSEYLLPRALTLALYCNHRFGATIGALTALFEQTPIEWLNAIRDTRRCVYDPVCRDRGGNCHACTHLAETSCRFFNLNLSRAFLFGGPDSQLGNIVGFFDPSLSPTE